MATVILQLLSILKQRQFPLTPINDGGLGCVEGCEGAAEGGFLKSRLSPIRVSLVVQILGGVLWLRHSASLTACSK
jgi:hypothetical protein